MHLCKGSQRSTTSGTKQVPHQPRTNERPPGRSASVAVLGGARRVCANFKSGNTHTKQELPADDRSQEETRAASPRERRPLYAAPSSPLKDLSSVFFFQYLLSSFSVSPTSGRSLKQTRNSLNLIFLEQNYDHVICVGFSLTAKQRTHNVLAPRVLCGWA